MATLQRPDPSRGTEPSKDDGPVDPVILSLDDVSVTYPSRDGSVLAIDATSLTVTRGSFVCIVGPSGCGKSTLLQVVGGFVRQSSGEARFRGRPITGPSPDRGVVFQRPALFPWATVLANAEFGPRVRGVPKGVRREAVEKALRTVGLWEFREKYPYQLSGGMQHRLAIVRAMANEPELLLMDEPFAALDALTREQMQVELRQAWRRSGMTVLFVTHSVEEALFLGTTVVVMSPRPGRIIGTFAPEFTHRASELGGREIKADPEFVEMREQILAMIYHTDGA